MSSPWQLSGELRTRLQPIYLFALAQETVAPLNRDQYAPAKLSLPEAHRLATGDRVLVAVIDSGVDPSHPDLAGAITANFDAAADDTAPHPHGTGMAGAIAAHRTMLGTAPRVGLLTVRAFGSKPGNAEGTTFNIIKGLDWAVEQGARVINMSFAGPSDPRLRDALFKASRKGVVLVAAAGNAGPRSPPLYPGADPNVIAVTATDADDALFPESMANLPGSGLTRKKVDRLPANRRKTAGDRQETRARLAAVCCTSGSRASRRRRRKAWAHLLDV